MERIIGELVPIAFFAMIVFVVYLTAKYNYQTKKAIIDRGGDIEFPKKRFPVLEIGLTFLGIGVGLGLSAIPLSLGLSDDLAALLTGSFVLLFGGLGLVTGFFMRRKLEEKQG